MSKRDVKVTIADVARLAGVSPATVSRVLNKGKYVRGEMSDKVHAAVRQLNYSPNLYAQSLAGIRSRVICIVFDKPYGDYITGILRGALDAARARGLHLVVETLPEPGLTSDLDEILSRVRPDGLILTPPVCDDQAVLTRLRERGTACVRIAPSAPFDPFARVGIDDRAAAADMTRYLLSLGHQHVGFIKGPADHGASADRLKGYKAALADWGVAYDPRLVADGLFSFESGQKAAQMLLSGQPAPTAIFASNDEMAAGVMAYAHDRGLRVPEALSVAGFDDGPIARWVWPALTTIRQPAEDIARSAVETLFAAIHPDDAPAAGTKPLAWTRIERQSTTAVTVLAPQT